MLFSLNEKNGRKPSVRIERSGCGFRWISEKQNNILGGHKG